MSLPVDNEIHELRLGSSFDSNSEVGFHTIRYDFKPASVDTSKEACVEVGEGNQMIIAVPHVEGSGFSHTVFKGNKQPLMKECVLVIDHNTGTYTLEKLTSKITVKKTRLDGSSKAMKHITGRLTPVDKKHLPSSFSAKVKSEHKHSPEVESVPVVPSHGETSKASAEDVLVGEITDSSDESDNEVNSVKQTSHKHNNIQPSSQLKKFEVLDDDLALSESDSDSDSD